MPLSSHQNSNSGSTTTSPKQKIPTHTLTKSHLSLLDTTADLYGKKWACLPKCANNSIIQLKEDLHILAIFSLYMESHTVSYTRTRLLGDFKVNQILDATLERDEGYVMFFCTTVEVDKVYRTALNHNTA